MGRKGAWRDLGSHVRLSYHSPRKYAGRRELTELIGGQGPDGEPPFKRATLRQTAGHWDLRQGILDYVRLAVPQQEHQPRGRGHCQEHGCRVTLHRVVSFY